MLGYAKAVFSACGYAVSRDPNDGGYRDARGIPRVTLGDYRGAIEDFEVYVIDGAPAYVPTRRDWIDKLQRGINPLDRQTIQTLLPEQWRAT